MLVKSTILRQIISHRLPSTINPQRYISSTRIISSIDDDTSAGYVRPKTAPRIEDMIGKRDEPKLELESAHHIWSRKQTGLKRTPRYDSTKDDLFDDPLFTPREAPYTGVAPMAPPLKWPEYDQSVLSAEQMGLSSPPYWHYHEIDNREESAIGQYPRYIPLQYAELRDPFKYWDQQNRRDFGELVYDHQNITSIWGPGPITNPKNAIYGLTKFFALVFGTYALFEFLKIDQKRQDINPKEFPFEGLRVELGGDPNNPENVHVPIDAMGRVRRLKKFVSKRCEVCDVEVRNININQCFTCAKFQHFFKTCEDVIKQGITDPLCQKPCSSLETFALSSFPDLNLKKLSTGYESLSSCQSNENDHDIEISISCDGIHSLQKSLPKPVPSFPEDPFHQSSSPHSYSLEESELDHDLYSPDSSPSFTSRNDKHSQNNHFSQSYPSYKFNIPPPPPKYNQPPPPPKHEKVNQLPPPRTTKITIEQLTPLIEPQYPILSKRGWKNHYKKRRVYLN